MLISSPHNARVRSLAALRRRQERERANVVLVEGYQELMVAIDSGARPLAIYYCPSFVRDPSQLELLERVRPTGAELVELGPAAFRRAAYRQNPDGWLAIFPPLATSLDAVRTPPDALLLVCESVEKPGNLGAMLRTADAAGVHATIAASPATDWANPNLIRASKGCVFSVPIAEAEAEEVLPWLRARQIAVAAATPAGTTYPQGADLRGPVALVIGSEERGLSRLWLEQADVRIRIPMLGRVNSLNAATAAALLVYEALRQRGRLAPAARPDSDAEFGFERRTF